MTNGHDAPVISRSSDFYNRWIIAQSISKVIQASPLDWSTRIGVYGGWGDGKTSLLNFLEKQQNDAGNIVIRYSSWGAGNELEAWDDFGRALIFGLDKAGINLGWFSRLKGRCHSWAGGLPGAGKLLGGAVKNITQIPGSDVGVEYASTIITKRLKITKFDVADIQSQLGMRKVIIFIDDLDRSDPAIIPKLLLILREVLDYSKFIFILAFDKAVVAKSLESYNAAWGSAQTNFLDKVVDFSFELPPPSLKQVCDLAYSQFALLAPFVPYEAIKDVRELLPSNPRKLKLLIRMVGSMSQEVDRHESSELDWNLILLFSLLRAESEPFTNTLLSEVISAGKFSWYQWKVLAQNTGAVEDAQITELMQRCPGINTPRVTILVNRLREACSLQSAEQITYMAMFALSPHNITWGEFKSFFKEWRLSKSRDLINQFIQERSIESGDQLANVEEEFIDTCLKYYALLLERAASISDGNEHYALILELNDLIELLDGCLLNAKTALVLRNEFLVEGWKNLYALLLQWRHFNANRGESDLRKLELDYLLRFADVINNPMPIYETLKPGAEFDIPLFDARSEDLKRGFTRSIADHIEGAAINSAYKFIREPGKIKKLRSKDDYFAEKFLLTNFDSPCFNEPHYRQFIEEVRKRLDTANVNEDAMDLLDIYLSNLRIDNYASGVIPNELGASLCKNSKLIIELWKLVISRPGQYRVLESIRERRKKLIAVGIPEKELEEPDWLMPREP